MAFIQKYLWTEPYLCHLTNKQERRPCAGFLIGAVINHSRQASRQPDPRICMATSRSKDCHGYVTYIHSNSLLVILTDFLKFNSLMDIPYGFVHFQQGSFSLWDMAYAGLFDLNHLI